MMFCLCAAVLLLRILSVSPAGDCEVCVGFLQRLYGSLASRDLSPPLVEDELVKACTEVQGKEARLCYYLGASSDAASRVTVSVARPMASHVPVEKICQRLGSTDKQICDLKYVPTRLPTRGWDPPLQDGHSVNQAATALALTRWSFYRAAAVGPEQRRAAEATRGRAEEGAVVVGRGVPGLSGEAGVCQSDPGEGSPPSPHTAPHTAPHGPVIQGSSALGSPQFRRSRPDRSSRGHMGRDLMMNHRSSTW
ncbi:hypothetical protein NHX12_020832 [Muraenolepis orangiensis]|uniref:ARMET N-terminal domain-containing protein n=1 Tax=Muraenolepis orangiensis TaxID=630683 RepID=A0A9Q0ESP1_9TELE|nr:hypothetical protein NHX12_020832 [Muraenolepis orangiensis]